jgi:hypothetical protein
VTKSAISRGVPSDTDEPAPLDQVEVYQKILDRSSELRG